MRIPAALKYGAIALALWGGLWLFWESLQGAILGVLNWLLVGILGVIPISLENSFPLIKTAWAVPAVLFVLVTGVVWIVFKLRRGRREDAQAMYEAADKMAELLTAGLAIRDEGQDLAMNLLESWIGDVAEWNQSVIEAIEIYSVGDAEWFAALDEIPPPMVAA